jgi:thiamine monophosphate synthase
VLDAGAAGVAVIGAILHARDVGGATRELLSEVASFSRSGPRR